MKNGKRMLTLGLAAILALGLIGCGKQETPSPAEQTQQTTQTTESTEATEPVIPEKEIDHLYNGLYIPLTESVSATEQDGALVFESDVLSGSVVFQKLDELPKDTGRTSEAYAQQLLSQTQKENSDAWMGTSTGVSYYVVIPSAEKIEVRGLYVFGDVCWEVRAESADPELRQQLVRIVGRCYIKENKIPQIGE